MTITQAMIVAMAKEAEEQGLLLSERQLRALLYAALTAQRSRHVTERYLSIG